MEADITSQAVGLASNTDFSILQLFIRADIIVKSVILLLIAASIYSWAIIIEKVRLFKKINKPKNKISRIVSSLCSLCTLGRRSRIFWFRTPLAVYVIGLPGFRRAQV